jgi:hypothetical protein
MHTITVQLDGPTYDLLATINESYFRDGVPREVERAVEAWLKKDYARDADGRYHRQAELANFAG